MLRRNSKRLMKYISTGLVAVLCVAILLKMTYTAHHPLNARDVADMLPQAFKALRATKALEQIKKDWHDYKQIAEDKLRTGAGEQGTAFYLPPGSEQEKDKLYKVNGFNAMVSDYIALNRSLPDIRHHGCKNKLYLNKLPVASVVVPFHNEHGSTLLRTVTSVLNRAPPELIKEIILVDDFSTKEPIALDKKTVVCPFIDVIDYETFAYRAQDEGARGSFDWELYYKRLPLLPEDLQHPTEPFKSPVMAGGLFAIDRNFFWELGGYDEGLDVWGGEQYELSFKIWQCGGVMVDAPCSRIGHIYRKFAPFPNPGIGDFVGRNYKRVAEVWMDEYKDFLYMRRPQYRLLEVNDLSRQKELRKKLNCKPFKWFMENVAFDQLKKYPPIEPPDFAKGEIRNVGSDLCVDTRFRGQNERFGLEKCIKDSINQGGEQQFVLTWHKDIRPKKRSVCFDVSSPEPHAPVVLWSCHGLQGNQLWKYDLTNRHLVHPVTGNCLDCDGERKEIFMGPCDTDKLSQHWKFEFVNASALSAW
ncbi:putative polypeptide N-acetylgalactosaminyltransferase 10 isoform X2 [Centruroides vittatus]|uniref:putative polypeptide N-acetylgalactosaminyltransferase 10 isoform X2 n=2 Tax=Centruroides TaxID=6875 RepID=UPI00350F31FC